MSVTSLEGKKVLVVGGGGQGIGREVTRLIGASGGELAVVDLDETRAREAADEIVDGGGKALVTNDLELRAQTPWVGDRPRGVARQWL